MDINSDEWKQSMELLSRTFNIDLDRPKSNLLASFVSLLLSWNEKTNLTSITDPKEIAEKHILDSIIPGIYIQSITSPTGITLMDVGSGGGFPGIPLKILLPQLQVTLVDSMRKKVNFLKYAVRTLGLDNICTEHSRIEELSKNKNFAGQFDVVISRAFSSLDKFFTSTAPLIKSTGSLIAMKANEVKKEIDMMASNKNEEGIYHINHYKLILNIVHYTLPESASRRTLVIAKKSE
jgi:16S rRNA (guanine527-N7)-methyltransferase